MLQRYSCFIMFVISSSIKLENQTPNSCKGRLVSKGHSSENLLFHLICAIYVFCLLLKSSPKMSVPVWIQASFDIVIGIIPVPWILLGSVFFFVGLFQGTMYHIKYPQILETPKIRPPRAAWRKKQQKTRWNSSWRSWKHIGKKLLSIRGPKHIFPPNHVLFTKRTKQLARKKTTKNHRPFFHLYKEI